MTIKEPQKIPDIIKTFTELPINTLMKKNLSDANFITPTPIQAEALKPALAGRDILGTAQTGTGKTLAFIIPILERLMNSREKGIGALILAPTRELAMQIIEELRTTGKGTGITATLAVGGLSEGKQIDSIRRGAKIIIATPGRLDDFVKRGLADLSSVKILVLDEADRMVDMGFLPQMRNIMNRVPQERQTMCFSATLDRAVAHLVHEYLKNPVRVEIGSIIKPAESVTLRIYEMAREQKFSLLMHLLGKEAGTFLVFTRTKYGADKLFKKLEQRGIDVGVLHGGKSQPQRIRALEGFKAGKHRVLVATDIAARGIHVQGIAHVLNYDMPNAAEDFIHRAGRTGRVEEEGVATTFVMPEETMEIQGIERVLGKRIERLALPAGLVAEPRSLHDEAFDMRSRRRTSFSAPRRFGHKRRR
ncbi:MAG: DEAD/DEAH box helicase [Candidatus Sungbacteria bacterium RIFCSPLOWO2_12_FULL_41_11]|uniref:DEAD/DEAH box helicase n=1 Tax=Candidatus Sungbacteria bacterium RIFCSPLOWO2_12_FULL_41_11 TaxID=1802286 RepID=A0A1G2LML7_9BACT|nr:MAG: DEAD/DEAH box helicase domain protein [Parcubacteria group bacterium GW2011_GWA2_42_14]OGZ98766.1 MAG: DEAD/DEAH box helicase [Candidatus Sungbacteria bacterium RIFCSPHIGHO2_02_FULL_41_12b]OHA12868.1 MAG: DEAD/DEAH box helicase [Candidatus Sungbacteria bacterium RIFCSPLOWO2_12_FULL_41_11]